MPSPSGSRYSTQSSEHSSPSSNKIYLWIDVVFRILLAGFIISLAIMIGEVLVIAVAEYLFFVDLNLFSLVDFFSLFFVAALGTIIYLAREGLDKFFDLKPIMED